MRVRWGVIGATGIADRRTIPEGILAADNSELAAVMSPTEKRVRAVAEKYGGVPWFTDAEEMLASVKLDAVYLASPPAFHLEQTRLCTEAGVHVFCEKPLALTVEQAQEMVDLCRQAGVKMGTAFMIPYHCLVQRAMQFVAQGALGQVVSTRVQFGFDYPPLEGAFRQSREQHAGGAFMDVGNHAMDVLERIVGSKVRTVQAVTANVAYEYQGVEDTCLALVTLDNGAVGIVDAYFCTGSARNEVEVTGTERTLVIRGAMGQSPGGVLTVLSGFSGATEELREESDDRSTYEGEIRAFAQAILTDSDPPISGDDGLWSQKLVAAVYQSAQTAQVVAVE